MTNSIRMINLSLQIWGSIFSVVLVLRLLLLHREKQKADRLFILMLAFNVQVLAMDALAFYFRGRMGLFSSIMVRFTNFVSFLGSGLIVMAFVFFLYEYVQQRSEEMLSRTPVYLSAGLFSIHAMLLLVNLFIPFAYRIGPDNLYERQSLYILLYIPEMLMFLISLWMLFSYRKKLRISEGIIFTLFVLMPLITVGFSTMFYGLAIGQLGTTAALFIMYLFLQADYGRRMAEQEAALTKSQMAAMMHQIRPHFIYNSLNSIRYLCEENGAQAAEAIDHFASYLRVNTDSFQRMEPVPFLEELEHTKHYLYIEKLRFPEVSVKYELGTTEFMIPPLTLQPAVENAVKHGFTAAKPEGTILIKTYEEGNQYVLKVIDDGVGFSEEDIKPDVDRNHVGVENTRQRIRLMSHGTYEISSVPGEGTTVTITIPREE